MDEFVIDIPAWDPQDVRERDLVVGKMRYYKAPLGEDTMGTAGAPLWQPTCPLDWDAEDAKTPLDGGD